MSRLRGLPAAAGIFAAAIGCDALVGTADAGAFAIREQSAYGQGMSFAGAATCGTSVAGTFWNSAVVTCAQGLDVEGSLSMIVPSTEITTAAFPSSLLGPGSPLFFGGDPGDIGKTAVVPATTVAYNVDERWYFGATINGQYGLKTETRFSHAAQIYGRESEVFSLNVNPVVGYRINDAFAVAAGLQIQYFDVILSQAVGIAPIAPSAVLNGDDIGFGFTAGLLITPTPNTEIGIGFRSAIKHDLEGMLAIPLVARLPIEVDPTLPEMVSFGLRHRFTDRFSMLGTVEWTNWSRFGTFTVVNSLNGLPVSLLPFEYRDGWFFALGAEYDWDDRWTLRAGAAWERAPIDDVTRSIRLPDDDRLWLSAGLSYHWSERLRLDLGYSFLTTFDTRINIGPGNPVYVPPVTFAADVDASVHIVAAGLKYSFGGRDAMEPVSPVYRP